VFDEIWISGKHGRDTDGNGRHWHASLCVILEEIHELCILIGLASTSLMSAAVCATSKPDLSGCRGGALRERSIRRDAAEFLARRY